MMNFGRHRWSTVERHRSLGRAVRPRWHSRKPIPQNHRSSKPYCL